MGQDDLKPEGRSVRLGGEAYDDDVEGHAARKQVGFAPEEGKKLAAIEPDGGRSAPRVSDDDDVEGHLKVR
jgi:hypothetical protein